MDIEHFLKKRVRFANNFHEQGCKPFQEVMRLIEQKEAPYEPVYDESGDPHNLFMSGLKLEMELNLLV